MDEYSYSDETRYTITFDQGGYSHEVKVDAWITAEFTAQAIAARVGRAKLVNNFNGAEACYRDGALLWSDKGIADLTA